MLAVQQLVPCLQDMKMDAIAIMLGNWGYKHADIRASYLKYIYDKFELHWSNCFCMIESKLKERQTHTETYPK